MVDLVKIRKKAREKKERRQDQGADESRTEATVPPPDAPLQRLARYREQLEFRRETIRRAAEEADQGGAREAETIELLTFQIGREEYAIPIQSVVEIVESPLLTRVPNAPRHVIGIVSLRGTIVTVLDLSSRLGHGPAKQSSESRLIVVNDSGGASGFIADRVSRVVNIEASAVGMSPAPADGDVSDGGVFRRNSGLTVVLDLERLLSV